MQEDDYYYTTQDNETPS